MAKKIRFPLKMKNGAEVRTLDELKENFDLESVLGYFTDGKLATWLADRYYDEKAEEVSALSADTPELNAKLCNILEVEYQGDDDVADLEYIQRRNEKLRILSAYTDNKDILNNIDIVAMSQDDLYDILDEDPADVYLYGERFTIPFGKKNVCYTGINEPVVSIDRSKYVYEYNDSGITFRKVRFEDNVNPYITKGEKLFTSGNYAGAFPYIEDSANSGNPRAMYLMGLYYYWGYHTVIIDIKKRNYWFEQGYKNNDLLASYWYAKWCVEDNSEEQTRIYRNIFNSIKLMADSGDNFAQHTLGSMYEHGRGTETDTEKAIEYYKYSADQGNALGQCNYGGMFNNENGDYYKATEWYRKSAEQGCALGQYNLAIKYENGDGVVKDLSKTFEWCSKAADQGYASAQDRLGDMYYYGQGVEKNYSKAFEWCSKAAEQGNMYSMFSIGIMYENGWGVCQDYSKAFEWYQKSAEKGYSFGQRALGVMYENGWGVAKNYSKAFELFSKAAEQGVSEAMNDLGVMYARGEGVAKSESRAIEWYKRAAKNGNETAQKNLRNRGIYSW